MFGAAGSLHDYVRPEWDNILAFFGWPTTHNIAIVGGGFGWSMEYIDSLGYVESYVNETSLYILSVLTDINSRDGIPHSLLSGRVLSQDLLRNAGRSQFRNQTIGPQSRYDVIVTERVLTSLTDQEAIDLSAALHESTLLASGGTVLHIDTPLRDPETQDQDFNWKPMSEWAALLPTDWICSSGGRDFIAPTA